MKFFSKSSLIAFLLGVLLTVSAVMVSSCNEQQRARQLGGNSTVELPQGQKLVIITWKEGNLWYLTKPMTGSDTADTYTFKESSGYGVMEGTVIIKERK
ncbi:hypothetical protein IPM19_00795 [bacterium]|nr:MAG: hypothetical protein IPM19_00795 [bacterium]